MAIVDEKTDQIRAAKVLELGISMDERFVDGLYYRYMLKDARRLIENLEILDVQSSNFFGSEIVHDARTGHAFDHVSENFDIPMFCTLLTLFLIEYHRHFSIKDGCPFSVAQGGFVDVISRLAFSGPSGKLPNFSESTSTFDFSGKLQSEALENASKLLGNIPFKQNQTVISTHWEPPAEFSALKMDKSELHEQHLSGSIAHIRRNANTGILETGTNRPFAL